MSCDNKFVMGENKRRLSATYCCQRYLLSRMREGKGERMAKWQLEKLPVCCQL